MEAATDQKRSAINIPPSFYFNSTSEISYRSELKSPDEEIIMK